MPVGRVLYQGGPCRGLTGPGGWVQGPGAHHGPGTRERVVPAPDPPTPAPWASGARSAGLGLLLSARSVGGWETPYYPPGIPTLYPPGIPTLVHPPAYTSSVAHHADGHGTTGTCTYDRFWNTVGEPRGMEYRGVLALFWHCLALFGPCLALVWHCLASVYCI